MQSSNFGKLNKPVQFPEMLNMGPYMSGTDDRYPVYSLYAVVVHLDIMNATFSGHYVCYIKNFDGDWFRIDDSTVCFLFIFKYILQNALPIKNCILLPNYGLDFCFWFCLCFSLIQKSLKKI